MTRDQAIGELRIIASAGRNPKDEGNFYNYLSTLITTALQSPWRSVKEELPECDMVLVDFYGTLMVAQHYKNGYDTESWWDMNGESCRKDEIRYRFTHFMPIPEIPEE